MRRTSHTSLRVVLRFMPFCTIESFVSKKNFTSHQIMTERWILMLFVNLTSTRWRNHHWQSSLDCILPCRHSVFCHEMCSLCARADHSRLRWFVVRVV